MSEVAKKVLISQPLHTRGMADLSQKKERKKKDKENDG